MIYEGAIAPAHPHTAWGQLHRIGRERWLMLAQSVLAAHTEAAVKALRAEWKDSDEQYQHAYSQRVDEMNRAEAEVRDLTARLAAAEGDKDVLAEHAEAALRERDTLKAERDRQYDENVDLIAKNHALKAALAQARGELENVVLGHCQHCQAEAADARRAAKAAEFCRHCGETTRPHAGSDPEHRWPY
jgi:chromosome segregation ATPase